MNTTTNLFEIRKHKHRFTWGTVIDIFDLPNGCTIVSYISSVGTDNGELRYHIYVGGEDTSQSTSTFDSAILVALSRKNLEANEARYMAQAAAKLLKVTID